jgi:predicted Rossmann fold nucleotide-binding protein DprA/Smf involved in DNA uptake
MAGMRLIVAGGRDFNDYNLLCQEVADFIKNENEVEIVSGLARGADTLGCQFAQENDLPLRGFAAEWGKFGRAAGPIRNKLMAKNADALIAFWDGQSRGTMHMIDYAKEMGLKVKVVQYGSL